MTPRLFAQADPSAPQRQPALLLLLIQLGVGACSFHLLPFGQPVFNGVSEAEEKERGKGTTSSLLISK